MIILFATLRTYHRTPCISFDYTAHYTMSISS
nr:MAG TPA: hypothetical protein [Caudoviricetes sp.]